MIIKNLHANIHVTSVCIKYTDVFICGNLQCNAVLKIVITYYRVLSSKNSTTVITC